MPSWCRALDAHRRAPGSCMAGEPPLATRIAPRCASDRAVRNLVGTVKENATLGWAGVDPLPTAQNTTNSLLHGRRPHSPQPNPLACGRCHSLKRRIGGLLDPTDGEKQPDRRCTGQARRTAPAPTVSLHGSRSAVARTLLN